MVNDWTVNSVGHLMIPEFLFVKDGQQFAFSCTETITKSCVRYFLLLEKQGRARKWCSMPPSHKAEQKQDDQYESTYSCSVRIRDVALKTCQKRWTIRRIGERGSRISVLAARHDDIYIYIYIGRCFVLKQSFFSTSNFSWCLWWFLVASQ